MAAIDIAASVVVSTAIVGVAVEFYDEPCLAAEEIGEVRAHWDLAAEFVSVQLAIAQVLPEEAFWWGG